MHAFFSHVPPLDLDDDMSSVAIALDGLDAPGRNLIVVRRSIAGPWWVCLPWVHHSRHFDQRSLTPLKKASSTGIMEAGSGPTLP